MDTNTDGGLLGDRDQVLPIFAPSRGSPRRRGQVVGTEKVMEERVPLPSTTPGTALSRGPGLCRLDGIGQPTAEEDTALRWGCASCPVQSRSPRQARPHGGLPVASYLNTVLTGGPGQNRSCIAAAGRGEKEEAGSFYGHSLFNSKSIRMASQKAQDIRKIKHP